MPPDLVLPPEPMDRHAPERSILARHRRRLRTVEDSALIAELADGRTDAFSELYDRYGHRANRVALAVCREEIHAQHAVQNTFVSVWMNRANQCAPAGTTAAWLLGSVRTHALELMGRSSGGEPVQDAIGRLPDALHEVITLAWYGQLSHGEIAAHLGLSSATVKARMRLGLQQLAALAEPRVA